MPSFNKEIPLGNLTRYGEQREEVTYVEADAFGRQADTITKYMTKGRPMVDSWETQHR